jgi:AsmA family protein
VLAYEPTERDVKVALKIDIDKLDYGILARRVKPDTDVHGRLSLRLDVDSRTPSLSQALRYGNGRIDFAIWPENMKSGVFDLWAVNLLVSLVPQVDPAKESRVNCALGSFRLTDGQLVDRTLILDTSRMRVVGTGVADFQKQSIWLRMRPQAKKAQFLSLATPVEVDGSFTDFKIHVSPGDVAETVARVATSLVWVPLQKLFGKKLPEDGSDVCTRSFDSLPLVHTTR